MLNIMKAFSLDTFTVDLKSKSLVNEISCMVDNLDELMQQIYPDACDVGFKIWNNKTNNITTWYFSENLMYGPDNEREVGGWIFKPTSETVREFPGLNGWVVTVFND